MLLPGIIPRVKDLYESGFGWVAHMMAMVYASVRLLPANHPYLDPKNIGRFGIRHVISQAANNLVFKKENIDQIFIFMALLAGFGIFALQFILLFFGFVIQPVLAATASDPGSLFATPDPTNDIAFMMLDKVFAVPDFFGSKYNPAGDIPPFNQGLHSLFRFYNSAMLLVAVLVFIYYIFILVGETAQTGTPFGRRFNHVWGPIRLIAAIGLLVPLNYGYNTAQYITLYAAKVGSGFATNGWHTFNNTLSGNYTSPSSVKDTNLIVEPHASKANPLVKFMTLAHTCKKAYKATDHYKAIIEADAEKDIKPYLIYMQEGESGSPVTTAEPLEGIDYEAAIEKSGGRDLEIVFGQRDPTYTESRGWVKALCGDIVVPITNTVNPESTVIQTGHYNLVKTMWAETAFEEFGERAVRMHLENHPEREDPCSPVTGDQSDCTSENPLLPDTAYKNAQIAKYNGQLEEISKDGRQAKVDEITGEGIGDEVKAYGWGGAGIWYNSIAEWNGSLLASLRGIPEQRHMPSLMEEVKDYKTVNDPGVQLDNLYNPELANGSNMEFNDRPYDLAIAKVMHKVYIYWNQTDSELDTSRVPTANAIIDLLNLVFGTEGLFSMLENKETHPLAQLVGLGKSIMEAAIRNVMIGLGASFGGGLVHMLSEQPAGLPNVLKGISSMAIGFATASLSMGFILYYVLPFMPFMYFFFGVGNWVKGIFEAMVGVPLWALAHLKLDGNGLPGDSAMNGYFLIFEIFVRPILMIVGLVASIAIFTAQVKVLNGIFELVTLNLTGFDCMRAAEDAVVVTASTPDACDDGIVSTFRRDVIDEFFFTVLYAIVVYMLATSSFKLIDNIPKSIMRWMGASVSTFNDNQEDPAKGLAQYVAFSGSGIAKQAVTALNQGSETLGQGLGYVLPKFGGDNSPVTGRGTPRPSGPGSITE